MQACCLGGHGYPLLRGSERDFGGCDGGREEDAALAVAGCGRKWLRQGPEYGVHSSYCAMTGPRLKDPNHRRGLEPLGQIKKPWEPRDCPGTSGFNL